MDLQTDKRIYVKPFIQNTNHCGAPVSYNVYPILHNPLALVWVPAKLSLDQCDIQINISKCQYHVWILTNYNLNT